MDLRQLRYFVSIVDNGSMNKASRQLYIAQAALSQQLAKLESEVGKLLLHRSAKGVTPTENGLALYHHARFMLRQLDQALSVARQETGEAQGMVSVGLSPSTLSAIGLPLVERVRERHPNILLNVIEGLSGHLTHMMRRRQLDLAVLFNSDLMSTSMRSPCWTRKCSCCCRQAALSSRNDARPSRSQKRHACPWCFQPAPTVCDSA